MIFLYIYISYISFLLKIILNHHFSWLKSCDIPIFLGFSYAPHPTPGAATGAASFTLAEAVLRPVTGFASRADFTEERPLGGLGREKMKFLYFFRCDMVLILFFRCCIYDVFLIWFIYFILYVCCFIECSVF